MVNKMTQQEIRIKLIRDHMRYNEKYSIHQIYMIYQNIMNEDYCIRNFSKVSQKTISEQFRHISKADSWLVKEGSLYYKKEPKCVFTNFHNNLIRWVNWGEKWINNRM